MKIFTHFSNTTKRLTQGIPQVTSC